MIREWFRSLLAEEAANTAFGAGWYATAIAGIALLFVAVLMVTVAHATGSKRLSMLAIVPASLSPVLLLVAMAEVRWRFWLVVLYLQNLVSGWF